MMLREMDSGYVSQKRGERPESRVEGGGRRFVKWIVDMVARRGASDQSLGSRAGTGDSRIGYAAL
jgi:hypothetical protein